jgi:hypothetical protein
MTISLSGSDKLITVDTDIEFDFADIYRAAADWAVLEANMQFLIPCASAGKAPLGGGLFTDIIYTLATGWKLRPAGYPAGTVIVVHGTVITDDATPRVVAPAIGSPVTWDFQVATAGTVTEVNTGGSGLSAAEHNQLMALPSAATIKSGLATGAEVTAVGSAVADVADQIEALALGGSGTGANEWTYTVTSTVSHLPLECVHVWATTDAGGLNLVANGYTDSFGVVTFWLDSGTYYLWSRKAGFTFANPDIEEVP